MANFVSKLRAWCDQSGQVAVVFALSIIPMMTVIAMTIDSQRVMQKKNEMQYALDSAVLRGAKNIQTGQKAANVRNILVSELKRRVDGYGDLKCKDTQVTFGNNNREIRAKLECASETMLNIPLGPESMNFSVEAVSAWDVGLLDVAFMFDISGSMASSSRINSLKVAAKDALEILIPRADPSKNDGVRIAMIAYDDMVDAGDTFEDVTGLAKRRTYYATDRYRNQRTVRKERYKKRVCRWQGRACVRRNERGSCTKWSGGKRKCQDEWRTRNIKEFYGPTRTRQISYTINSSCVWERPGDEAFTDAAPKNNAPGQPVVTTPKTKIYNATKKIYNASEVAGNPHGYMAAAYAYLKNDRQNHKDGFTRSGETCAKIQPMGLSKDRAALEGYINKLKTRGGTAGHQGIAWSWYLISDKWGSVFPGSSKPNSFSQAQGTKALILMSDGDFVDEEFKNELGTSDQQSRKLCDAIKAQNQVRIYTVAFQAPKAGKEVLEYCASSPGHAFTANDKDELSAAYQSIAGSLAELRITH